MKNKDTKTELNLNWRTATNNKAPNKFNLTHYKYLILFLCSLFTVLYFVITQNIYKNLNFSASTTSITIAANLPSITNETAEDVVLDPNFERDTVISNNMQNREFTTASQYAKIRINASLFADAHKHKLPVAIVLQLMDIFAWDIDFTVDTQAGDTVEVLYEEQFQDGKFTKVGRVLAAKLTIHDKAYTAIRYDFHNNADYYNADGYSLRKAFIRNPVKYTRISSYFSANRPHPVLHMMRAHKGVDFAAPYGTPVKASGNGKVSFIGTKGGYGKVIILQHGARYSTLYGHLSRFNNNLHVGSSVQQGQLIAYVGSTGLASGPHLHYEFRVDGVHKDPLSISLPRATPIPEKYMHDFHTQATQLVHNLEHRAQLYMAKNEVTTARS